MKVLDTWQGIAEIVGQEIELEKEEDWNIGAMRTMNKGGLKKEMNKII